MDLNQKLAEICKGFCIPGKFLGYETICVGNVNKTYEVKVELPDGTPKSFLVQNVNTYAFRQPIQLMENIDKVTEHIRGKNPGKTALHFHHTADRKTYIYEGENFWRMTNYIRSVTCSTAENPDILRNAGRAFGEFQNQLSDFAPDQLFETIPGFHDTRKRYGKLIATVAADPCGRVEQVREDIDYLLSVQDLACRLTDMQNSGQLPVRVTHNDTKINNVLFDAETGEALVVVDLDTVMPGLVGHDFGDAVRFAANREAEDSRNLQNVGVDLNTFRVFAEGFLEKTAKTLTPNEIDTLALSGFVLAVELATRFLDDYLEGDKYFNTSYPGHNLVRARCQIALAKDMQKHMDEMEEIVRQCVAANR